MKGIPQGRNTKELREEAVKLVSEGNLSIPEAAQRLSLPPSTLGDWLRASKAGKLSDIGKTQRSLTEIEMELARTKRELVNHRRYRTRQKAIQDITEYIEVFCNRQR
jgi:transposase